MKKISITVLSILVFLGNSYSWAQATSSAKPAPSASPVTTPADDAPYKIEELKALDYPELQVVPRASERLILESSAARDKGVMSLFPYVLSSTMTLTSGILVNSSMRPDMDDAWKQETAKATKTAMVIGVAGLGLAYWFLNSDQYGTSLNQIRAFKNKDRRTELLKERLAEETFEKTSTMISQWKWIFALVNFAASAELTGKSTGDNNVVPGLSMTAALLPLFITTSYESNYQKQLEYKKRIYVPLTWFDYQYDVKQANWQPKLNAVWNF